ncbi:MAG: thioredoxin-disulfide reductase [Chloroflexota bacterium]
MTTSFFVFGPESGQSAGTEYDVIVVGAGPAGMCAGLYCGRARLKTLVLDKLAPGGELLNTEWIEDYPGFRLIRGVELAQRMEEHAREFGAEFRMGTVTEVWSEGVDKFVRTAEGDLYKAKAVIVCTGGSPRKLGVPGEAEFAGRGVSYCAVCDGAFFQDQVLAVVGGGDAAVEEGTFLTRYARKVYIIHRRDQLRAQPILQERAFANPKIEFIWNTVVEEIGGNDAVEWVRLRNVKDGTVWTLPVNGVFIYIGFVPNSNIFRDPVQTDPNGYIITNERMETSIPGIFAAGDVRVQLVRQITNAVGDATTAAIAAQKYIEQLKDAERRARAADPTRSDS